MNEKERTAFEGYTTKIRNGEVYKLMEEMIGTDWDGGEAMVDLDAALSDGLEFYGDEMRENKGIYVKISAITLDSCHRFTSEHLDDESELRKYIDRLVNELEYRAKMAVMSEVDMGNEFVNTAHDIQSAFLGTKVEEKRTEDLREQNRLLVEQTQLLLAKVDLLAKIKHYE